MMQYPFVLDPTDLLPSSELITEETNKTTFFGMQAAARFNFMPNACIKHQFKRTFIGITPQNDEYTQIVTDMLSAWSK